MNEVSDEYARLTSVAHEAMGQAIKPCHEIFAFAWSKAEDQLLAMSNQVQNLAMDLEKFGKFFATTTSAKNIHGISFLVIPAIIGLFVGSVLPGDAVGYCGLGLVAGVIGRLVYFHVNTEQRKKQLTARAIKANQLEIQVQEWLTKAEQHLAEAKAWQMDARRLQQFYSNAQAHLKALKLLQTKS